MLKNRRTPKGRVERRKRRARAVLCNQVNTAYRDELGAAPAKRLAACREQRVKRATRIAAARMAKVMPAPEPFLIGGKGGE